MRKVPLSSLTKYRQLSSIINMRRLSCVFLTFSLVQAAIDMRERCTALINEQSALFDINSLIVTRDRCLVKRTSQMNAKVGREVCL